MSPQPANEYEQLSPEQAGHVDAVCDAFEQAWKAVPAGGPIPCIAPFLGFCEGPEHSVLLRELIALDRACRQRYGFPSRSEDYRDPGAADECAVSATTPCYLPFGTSPPLEAPAPRVGDSE